LEYPSESRPHFEKDWKDASGVLPKDFGESWGVAEETGQNSEDWLDADVYVCERRNHRCQQEERQKYDVNGQRHVENEGKVDWEWELVRGRVLDRAPGRR
jgi:hypothetical protein